MRHEQWRCMVMRCKVQLGLSLPPLSSLYLSPSLLSLSLSVSFSPFVSLCECVCVCVCVCACVCFEHVQEQLGCILTFVSFASTVAISSGICWMKNCLNATSEQFFKRVKRTLSAAARLTWGPYWEWFVKKAWTQSRAALAFSLDILCCNVPGDKEGRRERGIGMDH